MPRVVFIEGCGPMACSTYQEVVAAFDRAYAAPREQPMPVNEIFTALMEGTQRSPSPEVQRPAPEP